MMISILKAAALCAVLVQADHSDPVTNSASRIFKFGCKCSPTDYCWPSNSTWDSFNSTLGGKLILSEPPAIVCYPGAKQDLVACAQIVTQLTNSSFVGNNPIALDYPGDDDACPPVNYAIGQVAGNCTLGDVPVYSVDATSPADVQTTVNFARKRGLRLVVRNTGHDLLGRSTGYGALQIWIRHLRNGITFHSAWSTSCTRNTWTGAAFTIAGGYVWGEIYAEAAARNLIVVGGGDPSVGCIGGWSQGGGHSPANHDFGLGADQIIEAKVVLANGNLVTANACQNSDLFFAIRGGGGGTYGVVVSATIKAYPTTPYSAQVVAIAPYSDAQLPEFKEAIAILYESMPAMSDAGLSGYGSWATQNYAPVVGNYMSGYNHALAAANKSVTDLEATWAPIAARLAPLNGSLYILSNFYSFPDYVTYYSTLSGNQMSVGAQGGAAIGSRLLDGPALTNATGIRRMVEVTAGSQYQFTLNNFCLVGGGKVATDGADPYSGVNPAWRRSYVHNIVARGWQRGTDAAAAKAIADDITFTKTGAMRDIAPDTGAYMNEADKRAPTYLADFYGEALEKLQFRKLKYDPLGVFYCPTCVGSNNWYEDSAGRLCYDFGGGDDY